jgi:hypothetical protein
VFAVAALVRLGLIGRHSLWADEVFSLAIATGHSLEHPAATADPTLGDFVEPEGPVHAEEFKRYLAHDNPPASPACRSGGIALTPTHSLLLLWLDARYRHQRAALRCLDGLRLHATVPCRWLAHRRDSVCRLLLFALSPLAVTFSGGACIAPVVLRARHSWVSVGASGGSIAVSAAWWSPRQLDF